jgi:hypothetical protein
MRRALLSALALGIAAPAMAGTTADCVADSTTLCLNDRFSVRLSWSIPPGALQPAAAVPLSDSAGSFWFFESSNVEFVVKVLDGCAINHAWWVFGTSLTSLPWMLEVTDTVTGDSFTYPGEHSVGVPPAPYLQETDLFSGSCP